MENKVSLKVNDKDITLNAFVQEVFVNVINGLVDSLDNVPAERDRRIDITVEKK